MELNSQDEFGTGDTPSGVVESADVRFSVKFNTVSRSFQGGFLSQRGLKVEVEGGAEEPEGSEPGFESKILPSPADLLHRILGF